MEVWDAFKELEDDAKEEWNIMLDESRAVTSTIYEN